MGDSKFVYNARFVGRKPVEGPLNDFRLSEVVAGFQGDVSKTRATCSDEIRCNLEFSDKNLLVTFIKKDEGFESDTESAKSVENQPVVVTAVNPTEDKSGVDEKIIKDHVFRFSEPGGDDSYSSNSGGSDSETSDHNKSSSGTSSASSTPTAELNKYKFDHLDTYHISDVLICHTDKVHKNCVICVIRKTGTLEALVFECTCEDNARQLYKKFHEVSKRSKLERHRRRKSDGGSIVTRGSDFVGLTQRQTEYSKAKQTGASPENVTINNIDTSVIEKAVEKNHQKWNLVQHTDKNGVTHIEVESTEKAISSSTNNPTHPHHNLVKNRDLSVAEPRSLVSFSPQFLARGLSRPSKNQDRSKFAKELESILSSKVREGAGSGRSEAENSPYSRQRNPGESLSLRQRAPAMLLKKLDEFEEKAHKIWAKAELEEENRKIWNKSSNSVIGITSPAPPGPQLEQHSPHEKDKTNQKSVSHKEKHDIDDNQKNHAAEKEKFSIGSSNSNNNIKSKHKDPTASKKQPEQDGTNRILIPTKTGKEPPKKLYPKESPPPPMFTGHGRFLPMGVGHMSQPHSLPIYPVQLTGVPWGHTRYPPEMSQLDLSQTVWKFPGAPNDSSVWRHSGHGGGLPGHGGAHGGHGGAHGGHGAVHQDLQGRSRSRDRSRVDMEQRRRAQSKSPARRPAPRYMDSVNIAPDISGISRMFREFGGAVRAKMSSKKPSDHHQKMSSCSMSDLPEASQSQLKSNLKKHRNQVGGDVTDANGTNASNMEKVTAATDNKKVHFNKFATVQMMG